MDSKIDKDEHFGQDKDGHFGQDKDEHFGQDKNEHFGQDKDGHFGQDNDNDDYCCEEEEENEKNVLFDHEKSGIGRFLKEWKKYVQWKVRTTHDISETKLNEIKNKSDPIYHWLSDEYLIDLHYTKIKNQDTAQHKALIQKKLKCFNEWERLKVEYPNLWKIAQSVNPWNHNVFSRRVSQFAAKKGPSTIEFFLKKFKPQLTLTQMDTFSNCTNSSSKDRKRKRNDIGDISDSGDTFTSKKSRTVSANTMQHFDAIMTIYRSQRPVFGAINERVAKLKTNQKHYFTNDLNILQKNNEKGLQAMKKLRTILFERADSDEIGWEFDMQAINTQAIDTQSIDTQAIDTQSIDTQAIDTQAIDTQAIDKQAIDKQAIDKQAIDKQAIDKQAIDKQAIDKQAIDKQTIDKPSNQDQSIEQNGKYFAILKDIYIKLDRIEQNNGKFEQRISILEGCPQ